MHAVMATPWGGCNVCSPCFFQAIEDFFLVYIASSKDEDSWENLRQLCKPETQSSNSPIVQMRLCKHGKKSCITFIKYFSQKFRQMEENANYLLLDLEFTGEKGVNFALESKEQTSSDFISIESAHIVKKYLQAYFFKQTVKPYQTLKPYQINANRDTCPHICLISFFLSIISV